MKIQFHLGWIKGSQSIAKAFKLASARDLFFEYLKRISKFVPCEALGAAEGELRRKSGARVWVCGNGLRAVGLTSEELALQMKHLLDSGARSLDIWIGGADGFSKGDLEQLNPDLLWSFGPLTLPHELAAVIAGEQLYRAWTILRKQPYHLAH